MGVRNLARAALIGTAAITLASSPSAAQLVTFSSFGSFSGGSCNALSCTFGGYVLTFSGVLNTAWTPPNDVTLGDFAVTCYSSSCDGGDILSGSTFMLTILQNGPTFGLGSISGSLGWDASSNTLSWTPDQGSVTIGSTTYNLGEGGSGCAVPGTQCIDINTPNVNFVPTFTNVTDPVTSTPEPATIALTATGLAGLIPLARRRRKS